MASLICVLCFAILEKRSDINLVKGKRSIDIAAEIEDLDFVVQPVSNHICRPCMSVVSQRITHRQKLANLNAKLLNNYLDKARANGLAVKMKHSSKRCGQPLAPSKAEVVKLHNTLRQNSLFMGALYLMINCHYDVKQLHRLRQ